MRQSITGRTKRPLLSKLNPVWWFGNEQDPSPPDWYRPGGRLRTLTWYLRNPLSNFTKYVVGVEDRNYVVEMSTPSMANLPSDVGQTGWLFSLILLPLPRPYFAYTGKRVEGYVGWQPEGKFGVRFTLLKSGLQLW